MIDYHSTIYKKIINEFYKHDNKVRFSVYTDDGLLLTIIHYQQSLYYFDVDDIVNIDDNMQDDLINIHPFLPDFFKNKNAVCITASILGDERINSFIYKAVSSYTFEDW